MTAAQSRPRNASLPLLCALGRHKTDLLVRWNDGYYFTRCRRCGLDLVRTAFSGWTAPKRYRVVWQAEPPATIERVPAVPQADAEAPSFATSTSEPQMFAVPPETTQNAQVEFPIREDAPAAAVGLSMTDEAFAARPVEDESEDEPLPAESRSSAQGLQGTDGDAAPLPIEDVLQSLRSKPERPEPTPRADHDVDEESRGDRIADEVEERRPSPPTPPRVRYPVIPDFMDEEFPGITWDPSTGRMISDQKTTSEPASPEARPGWRDAIREKAQAATASGFERLRTRTADVPPSPEDAPEPSPPRRTSVPSRSLLERHGGLVAAIVFGGFVLAAAMVDRGGSGGDRIAYRPELRTQDARTRPAPVIQQRTASVAARPSTGGDDAFVTASLLNCRAVPADDGETVRRLSRGDAVKVLGADPGWVSVSHQGRQCWASAQWISTVRPL